MGKARSSHFISCQKNHLQDIIMKSQKTENRYEHDHRKKKTKNQQTNQQKTVAEREIVIQSKMHYQHS